MNAPEQLNTRGVQWALAGPGTPGGKFLRQFWQPVYMSSLLKPGKAKPIHIMGEKLTLFRGESGTPYVVAQRCAHRSTQLSTGWVVGENIRCLYHGWAFNGKGACVERPGEVPPGPAPGVQIKSYPTCEFLGLIYAYMGEGEPPPYPPFPGFKREGIVENLMEDFPCNWFQTQENHVDEAHLSFVHSTSGSHSKLGRTKVNVPDTYPEEAPFGLIRNSKVGNGQLRSTLIVFPNTMRIFIPSFPGSQIGGWRDSYLTLVPTDDENHILFMTQLAQVKPEERAAYEAQRAKHLAEVEAAPKVADLAHEILAGKAELADFFDHPRFLLLEDAVAQGGQGGLVDRTQERLGRTDVCIVGLRRLWDQTLEAIAQGKPTKQFVYSGEEPTLGY